MNKIVGLMIAALALGAGAGCTDDSLVSTSTADPPEITAPPVELAYPNYSFGLNVPWLPQVLPGTWSGTKNCGQACGVMLGGYFNNGAVQPWVITAENEWLANYTGDNRYRDANGWYTGGSRLGAFREMLRQFHGLQSAVYYGSTPEQVVNEIRNGRPVIVGVMIKNGQIVCSGGVSHWALAVGWDGRIILRDPGSSQGQFRAISVEAFNCTWGTQGRIYLPIWK